MKIKFLLLIFVGFILSGCVGVNSHGLFGTGVSVALDPRTLQITKIAWETKGTRSVRNDIKIKEEFNFKQSAKDILITTQLRTALIVNKNIKATNYQIDTYKKKNICIWNCPNI